MKTHRVILFHRHNNQYRHLTGWWSYPIHEFTWDERSIDSEGFRVNLAGIEREYDLAVLDDWTFGIFENRKLPLAYVVVDSARSAKQFQRNVEQAVYSDLILVDSDELAKFRSLNRPVRRFAHAVNEQLFYPRPKEYDVAFLCWPTATRRVIQAACTEICARHGWKFLTATYADPQAYAAAIGSAKIVVHRAHVDLARSWRVFDVMASRGCLLSSHLPTVSGDGLVLGTHYREYSNAETLENQLIDLLADDHCQTIAEASYRHVMVNHTWKTRAAQLSGILADEFKWV